MDVVRHNVRVVTEAKHDNRRSMLRRELVKVNDALEAMIGSDNPTDEDVVLRAVVKE